MQTITISTPSEDLTVSQNGNQPPQSSNELEKLLKANTTLTVWLIFLCIGGGLLARYYLRIGYLPDMEWNAALIYLFICSVWGGVVGLLLTISLYLPGVIWCDIIVFEPILDNKLTFEAEHDERSGKRKTRKEPCIKSIMICLGIPFFLALVISHLLLRASDISINERIDFYWVFAGLVLVGTFFLMRGIFIFLLKPKTDAITRRQIFKYSIWFTLSVLLNQISMYVIYRLADRTPDRYDFFILTGLCTAGVWISTHVVAVRHQNYPRQALVAALVTAVLLLFVADRFSDLSMKLMSRYGIGDGKKFNLLVSKEVVELVSSEGVSTCGPQHLCDVEILSKVGDHYFLKVNDKNNLKLPKYLTLPKKDVIAVRSLRDH